MASIYLTTAAQTTDWNPRALDNYNWLKQAMLSDQIRKHSVSDSMDKADIVLFIGARAIYYSDVINSKYFKKYPEKCMVFDTMDYTIPRLPGLYARIAPYLHNTPIYQYGFYPKVAMHNDISAAFNFSNCFYLFSFMGTVSTYPRVRQKIVELKHSRSLVRDASDKQRVYFEDYIDVIRRSKFVICPRGASPSSQRCFEAMMMGRAPIIISDDWRPPRNINWDEFSIHIPESQTQSIPERLEALESNAEEMGRKAKAAYDENFSRQTCFHWTVEQCLEIKKNWHTYQNKINRNIFYECFRDMNRSLFMNISSGKFDRGDFRNFVNLMRESYKSKTGKLKLETA